MKEVSLSRLDRQFYYLGTEDRCAYYLVELEHNVYCLDLEAVVLYQLDEDEMKKVFEMFR